MLSKSGVQICCLCIIEKNKNLPLFDTFCRNKIMNFPTFCSWDIRDPREGPGMCLAPTAGFTGEIGGTEWRGLVEMGAE